ncbi:MAG: hypothetical protein A2583_13240 [Bdellovibrionales bacterium RIFOXYD1_FULL_53_11]|nr:MAG: hypothetical protein A2583_13240 [Bdellovibrionales bacterium RIFOXYD1_FULL_53_11]
MFVSGVFVVTSLACGVKQYNAEVPVPPVSKMTRAYGPFSASGQVEATMSTASCNSAVGRPCVRARASVGTPYFYDVNSNDSMGNIDGTTYPAAGPYTTVAGAGKTMVTVGTKQTRAENRDLYLLHKQVGR